MTRYAVGDLQGCLEPLQCLLEQVAFDSEQDQLWVVGDLINRGPDSLGTLRFIKSLGNAARCVLGNHDLHFLAIAFGTTHPRRSDTFDEILAADDRQELVAWLRQLPLMYTDPSGDYCMSHAGISPLWSIKQAQSYAKEVEAILQSEQAETFFTHMYGNNPNCWNTNLESWERYRTITNYFTRMRFCGPQGELDLDNKTDIASPGFTPWFNHPSRKTQQQNIIFGHWAALQGNANTDHIFALDTGCVWGEKLSLLNLETQTINSCEC